MSLASVAPPAPRRTPDPQDGPALRDALHAEWTKVRTAPGAIWLLVGTAALTAAVGAAAAAAVSCPAGGLRCGPGQDSA